MIIQRHCMCCVCLNVPLSGHLVGRMHHGRDAARETTVQRKWPYPSLQDNCEKTEKKKLWFWCGDYVPKSHPQCIWILDHFLSDLDQLMEIMKITGTPTKEFTAKLQSEDVCFIHIFLLRLVCRTLSRYIMNTFEMWKSKVTWYILFFSRLETT